MFCSECGEKLTLRFLENEGLIPFCPGCNAFKFPLFPIAVSMTVVNRAEDKVLIAKHVGEDDFTLVAGYVKKGENAERTITRELREELKLNAVKWRYFGSKFHEQKNLLMLNFIVIADDKAELKLKEDELTEARWCSFDEAKQLIRKESTAEYFLLGGLGELSKKK